MVSFYTQLTTYQWGSDDFSSILSVFDVSDNATPKEIKVAFRRHKAKKENEYREMELELSRCVIVDPDPASI